MNKESREKQGLFQQRYKNMALTKDILRDLKLSLSPERFKTYLEATGKNPEKAMRLYVWNASISAAFYGPLQALEVALRNAIHIQLAEKYGANRYDHSDMMEILDKKHRDKLKDTKDDLQHRNKDGNSENMVAMLSFGFWVFLLSSHYDESLWRPALHKAFPHARKIPRRQIYRSLNKLLRIRNRIAHHEPIFNRYPERHYQNTLTAIGWISPSKKEWVKAHSRVEEILATPQDDPAVRF